MFEALTQARICSIDIETTPSQSMVFKTGKQHISHNQLLTEPKISTVTYKFLGEKPVLLRWNNKKQCDKGLVQRLSEILPQCHYVIGHNYQNYDDKFIQARALLNGLPPIPNYNIFDTYKEAKKVLTLPSLKLDYLAYVLFNDQKLDNGGMSTFIDVAQGDIDALEHMGNYNIKDTYLTEQVFLKLLPYTDHTGSFSLVVNGDQDGCSACGSTNIGTRGYRYTRKSKQQRYQCNNCGKWSHDSRHVKTGLNLSDNGRD